MKRTLTLLALSAALLSACTPSLTPKKENTMQKSPIYEIAIQEVKPGMQEAWKERRTAFLKLLGERSGNEKDWTFPAFFTFPEPGPQPVYVGITRWSDMSDSAAATQALMPTPEAQSFFETVNLQAFVQVEPADGKPFALESHIHKTGQVIEAAVRRAKAGQEGPYITARDSFFAKVAQQPGYIFHREFVTKDGWQAVLIGWESQTDFQAALGALSQMPEMNAFFSLADVKAYQAALVP